MAVIKATDILAQVAHAKARVASAEMYFQAAKLDGHHMTEAKHQAQLEQTAEQLADYVRKLPMAVQNKQAKACSAAKAYADHILKVEIPSAWGK